jgi:hypothetical protein
LKAWGGRGKLRPLFFVRKLWEVSVFISLLAQRNEPKKGHPGTCPAAGGIPCAPRCCRGFANSASPQTVQIPFSAASPVLGGVPMGIFPPPFVLPRLADGGGKRRGNCLRAKPEFFRVPPSARSKGSPQGQDWLGCLFLVSSFGHAKEERGSNRKGIAFIPVIPG